MEILGKRAAERSGGALAGAGYVREDAFCRTFMVPAHCTLKVIGLSCERRSGACNCGV